MYAIMKNLKSKYPDQYDWVYPIPGDWHIMKTEAEVIKYVLNNGRVVQGCRGDSKVFLECPSYCGYCIGKMQ